MANQNVISTLNELIETCKDGQAGYLTLADVVKDQQLTNQFTAWAQQRGQFASELQTEVLRLGGEPEQTGSTAGAMHRGWSTLKSTFTGNDDAAALVEAERGEEAAVQSYRDALEGDLDPTTRAMAERQYNQIQDIQARVKSLAQTYKKSA